MNDKEIEGIYLANSLQEGFLYHSLKQGDIDDAYIVQSVYEYKANLDIDKLKSSWKCAQMKYSSLRLRFDWQDELLLQIIDKEQELDWRFINIENEENQELKVKEIQEKDRNERYQLNKGNLFRIYLIKQKSDLFSLLFSCHHIILDGWSSPILFHFVHKIYFQLLEGDFNTENIIKDETYEKTQLYLQNHRNEHLAYWKSEVDKIEERCDLSCLLKDEYKNKIILNQYDHVKNPKESELIIKDNLYKNLKKFSIEHGITLNTIFQFVWHKILNIYGNSNQTITGTVVSGRNLPIDDIEHSVGLFINTLPLIINHNETNNYNLIDTLKNLQEKLNEMNSKSNINLSLINNTQKHNLFDCLFVYENYPDNEKNNEDNNRLLNFKTKYNIEKLDYPLTITAI